MSSTTIQFLRYSAAKAAASAIGLDLPMPGWMESAVTGPVYRRSAEADRLARVVSGAVVEIGKDASETVLRSLALLRNVSVFGIKDHQIVIVIEDDNMNGILNYMDKIREISSVVEAYPVFARYHKD
jgi:nitrate reductase NapAB chaperone NapD